MLTPGAELFGTLEKAARSGDCKGIRNPILIPFQVVVYAPLYLRLVLQGLHGGLEERTEDNQRPEEVSWGAVRQTKNWELQHLERERVFVQVQAPLLAATGSPTSVLTGDKSW